MEYDYKDIAVKSIAAAVVALIIGLVLAYFNVGEYSFVISVLVVGIIIGLVSDSIDSALLIGGVAGLIVSILQGIVPHFVLPPQVASLFGFSILGQVVGCALPAGIVALIKDIKGWYLFFFFLPQTILYMMNICFNTFSGRGAIPHRWWFLK